MLSIGKKSLNGGVRMKINKAVLTLSVISILILMTFGVIGLYVNGWENKIYPNSYVGNINISGMGAEQAKAAVENYEKENVKRKVCAVYGNKTFSTSFDELKKNCDIDSVIDKAMKYGKNYSMLKKFELLKAGISKGTEFKYEYDEKAIRTFIENIKKDMNRAPKNAYISDMVQGNPVIVQEVYGEKLKEEELLQEIVSKWKQEKGDILAEIKVSKVKPEVTVDTLKSVDTLVASFTTNYAVSKVGRAENIALAASKVNGTNVLPGEVFSFNSLTGERSLENGFKGAPIIVKNKLVDGVAGGVCQVSTTLHNAILKVGIKPIQRRNHSLAPAYVQPGFDATVSEAIDYKFKNTLKYPLYIQGKAKNGKLTFNIYSNSAITELKYVLSSEIIEVIEPQVIYNSVDTIPTGAMEKIQGASIGYKVNVFLIGYKNGKEVSREFLYKDNYTKVDEIFNVGI